MRHDTRNTSQLLGASSFLMSLGAGEDVEDCVYEPYRVTLWGEGRYRRLGGSGDGSASWNGDLLGARLGLDRWSRQRWLTGLMLDWSDGTFDWTAGTDGGAYGIALTSLHPYVGWRSLDGDLGLVGNARLRMGPARSREYSGAPRPQDGERGGGGGATVGDQHHAAAGRHDDVARQG